MSQFDPASLQMWLKTASWRLDQVAERIDALNVFPVADSDTGTNVALTVAGVLDELSVQGPDTLGSVALGLADSARKHARGSSGVILAGWFDGLAAGLADEAISPGDLLSVALKRAADSAKQAVAYPWPGTMLEVAEQVAVRTRQGGGSVEALKESVATARTDLARTSANHPVLREAGVVDSGACALLVLLEVLVAVLGDTSADTAGLWIPESSVEAQAHNHDDGAFEVMLDVTVPVDPVRLVGSAAAVTGSGNRWRTHVHTDDPPRALQAVDAASLRVGLVKAIQIPGTGVVVATRDPGLVGWFAAAGAAVVIPGLGGTPTDVIDAVAHEGGSVVLATDPDLARLLGALCGDPVRAAIAAVAESNAAAELANRVRVIEVNEDPVGALAALQGGEVLTVVPRIDQDLSEILVAADLRGLDVVLVGPAHMGSPWWLGLD